jgi:tetratricopeptide (TPR) repeat protein
MDQRRDDEAESHFRTALGVYESLYGAESFEAGEALSNLATVSKWMGRYADAESLNRRALAIHERRYGPQHPLRARAISNLAMAIKDQGRLDEAYELLTQALGILRGSLDPSHPDLAQVLYLLGRLTQDLGRLRDAEPLLAESLEIRRRALPRSHPDVAITCIDLARNLVLQGRASDALELIGECRLAAAEAFGPGHWSNDYARALEGAASLAQGDFASAEQALLESRRALESNPRPPAVFQSVDRLADVAGWLVELYEAMAQPDRATEWRAKLPGESPAPPAPANAPRR